jgi:hypothetical protein
VSLAEGVVEGVDDRRVRSGLADGAVATTVVLLGAGAGDDDLVAASISVALAFRAGEVEAGDRG